MLSHRDCQHGNYKNCDSVTLHKITAALAATWHSKCQCFCITPSTYATVALISQPAHSVQHIPHIHKILTIECLQVATGAVIVVCVQRTWSLQHHVETNQHIQLILSQTPCLCTLHITHNLGRTFKRYGHFHIAYFLFHMPWNFTYCMMQ